MKSNINKKIEILILLLVFAMPFNFHYIFNFSATKDLLFFKENLQYSLYFFDILFLVIFFYWILQKIKLKKLKKTFSSNKILLLLIFYLLWNSISISSNSMSSFYNSLRLWEVLIFLLIFVDIVKTKNFLKKTFYLIFFSGVIQSIIALLQFIFQESLNLKYLGESVLSPTILGVAKLEVNGEKFIRSYGTFPHPNILGAFLFFAFIAGLYFALNKNFKTPFKVPSTFKKLKISPRLKFLSGKFHVKTGLLLILIGILTTFSRSIWLIIALLSLYLTIKYFPPWQAFGETGKYLIHQKYRFKLIFKSIYPILIILIILLIGFYKFIPARLCTSNCQDQSLVLRNQYADFSKKEILHNNCWTGIGIGQFPVIFKILNPQDLPEYQIQPVHNFYLLAWSEIGLIGLVLLILLIYKNFKTISFSKKSELPALLIIGFLTLGFFDHYFWSLPQGQFIFWLALALLITSGKIDK